MSAVGQTKYVQQHSHVAKWAIVREFWDFLMHKRVKGESLGYESSTSRIRQGQPRATSLLMQCDPNGPCDIEELWIFFFGPDQDELA